MNWLVGILSVIASVMGIAVIWLSFLKGGYLVMFSAIALVIFLLGFLIWIVRSVE